MTNKGILKRKERRRRKREWKIKTLRFAKDVYNEINITPSEEVRRFFEAGQNIEVYLRDMGVRKQSISSSLPPSS